MAIAGRLLGGYAERNLRTGSGIRMRGRDIISLDECEGGETGQSRGATNMLIGMNVEYLTVSPL